MKKLTNEYRLDARLRWVPWMKARLVFFASFTRRIDKSPSPEKGPEGKPNGAGVDPTPGSTGARTVQGDTDLGG